MIKVQGKEKNQPFLILRDYTVGYMHRYPEILQILDRHPGLIEEIWFGYQPRTMEDARKEVESLKPFVHECKKRNIRFAIQHGITLGHGEISGFSAVGEGGNVQLAALPENAWAQARDGHRMWGVLCPRSVAAWKHIYDLTAYILTELDVESFWIDDDFRLGFYKSPCFCTRCIKAFNKQFGHSFTRKKLIHHLYEKIDPVIRGEWSDFQQESLAICAEKSYRKAFDDTKTKSEIGIQLVSSEDLLGGRDYSLLYKALGGKKHEPVGIRPGALYYDDIHPRDMFVKAISIARECARSRKSGLVGQMCFETENWPHVSSLKTPESQMRECALALFNGVDSLALYWFSFATFESLENYQYYFDTLAEYRPYFETVQRACADTQLTGIAPYYGENSMLFPDYQLAYHQLEALLFGAYPFTVAEADPRIYALNGRLAGLLTENDVKNLMKKNVLLDIEAYRCLAKILPDHSVFAKIRLADDLPQWQKCLPGTEVFDGEHFRFTPRVPILPQSPDVRAFSTILEMPDAVGTCVIPTGEGGNLLLTQRFDKHWTTLIRKAVADMLDLVTDGKFPARMLTGGFSVSLQTRNNKAGKTTALYLQNVSVGRTMPLDVSIRCPEKGDYYLYRGCEAPQKLCCRYVGSDEMIVTVPPLQAWQSALIAVSVN